MKFRSWLFLLALPAAFANASRAEDAVRFSKTLAPAEFSLLGLAQLSSDQLASLDALVRRDLAQADWVTKEPRPARFSARLAATERTAAGLDRLDPAQLAALDAAVQRLMPPPRQPYSVAAAAYDGGAIPSDTFRRTPEVHGAVTLMVGAGSHGYSAYGGGVMLEVDDPAHHLALAIAYSEVHEKGGYLYRGCRSGYTDFRDLGLGLELGR